MSARAATAADEEVGRLVDEELAKLEERRGGGGVADTYDNLQGVPFLNISQRRLADLPEDRRALATLLQCAILARANLNLVIENLSLALEADDAEAAAAEAGWLPSLADLELKILRRAERLARRAPADAEAPRLAGLELFDDFARRQDALGGALQAFVAHRRAPLSAALGHGYRSDPLASLTHDLKNYDQSNRLCGALWRSTPLPFDPRDRLAPRALVAAVVCWRTTPASFLPQFRLAHQIPELIALRIGEQIDAIAARTDAEVCARLDAVAALMEPATWALEPLADLMYPAAYYRFRRVLGVTSGSQSARVAKGLLIRDYERLCAALAPRLADPADPEREAILWRLENFRADLIAWRDAHLALPRNLLGADRTKSLIGSEDAIAVAEGMRAAFLRRDPLRARPPGGAAPADEPGVGRALLALTGEVARQEFADVQTREGRFRPRGRP